MKIKLKLIVLISAFFSLALISTYSEVLITEISPPGTGAILPVPGAKMGSDVWMEIQNIGNQPESIDNWMIIHYSTVCTPTTAMTFPDIIMQPDEILVIQFNPMASAEDSEINDNNYGFWDIITPFFYIEPEFDYFVITDSSGVVVDAVIFRQDNYLEYDTMTYRIDCMVNSGAWTISEQEQEILDNDEFPMHITVVTKPGYGIRRISIYDTDSATDWEIIPGSELSAGRNNLSVVTQELKLFQNYPNPFFPSQHDYTVIEFYTSLEGTAKVRIYDLSGSLIAVLFEGNPTLGTNRIYWNGTNDRDKNVDSATYLISVEIGEIRAVKPMTLIR